MILCRFVLLYPWVWFISSSTLFLHWSLYLFIVFLWISNPPFFLFFFSLSLIYWLLQKCGSQRESSLIHPCTKTLSLIFQMQLIKCEISEFFHFFFTHKSKNRIQKQRVLKGPNSFYSINSCRFNSNPIVSWIYSGDGV